MHHQHVQDAEKSDVALFLLRADKWACGTMELGGLIPLENSQRKYSHLSKVLLVVGTRAPEPTRIVSRMGNQSRPSSFYQLLTDDMIPAVARVTEKHRGKRLAHNTTSTTNAVGSSAPKIH